jgi:hypothetical protein
MTGGFAVAPAACAISAAAAPYRPENPKKLQDQWLKDELGRRPALGLTISAHYAHPRRRGDRMKAMSAIGTKQTGASAPHMSAFGSKADMFFCTAHVCF